MKNKTVFAFLLSVITLVGCTNEVVSEKTTIKTFNTNENKLSLKLNGQLITPEWALDTSLKPHIFEAECVESENIVTFLDSKDSISFTVKTGKTIDFAIVNAAKDTAFTQIVGIEPNHNFTKAYIAANKGKTKVAIPEVSELANILIALHRDAEKDKNMTDSDTDYYKRVRAYFKQYQNHPMMDTIQKYIGGIRYVENGTFSIFSDESYRYYYALKMNACTYQFEADGTIVNEGYIKEMAKGWSTFDPFKDKELMEDFARKSNFRAFYKENQAYYDELLTTYKTLNPISQMQQWLDDKFRFTYGNYSVYFSPLVMGAHSTKGFDTKDFKQTFMFIARADFDDNYTRTMNELVESRVVFTEIDHNYVDIISLKKIDKINQVFSNRGKWAKGDMINMYPNPFKVFNEYMTFAVYSLYISDNYDAKDVAEYLPKMESQMAETRGFIQFKDFNQTLLQYYKANPNLTIEELYDFILDWSAKRNV